VNRFLFACFVAGLAVVVAVVLGLARLFAGFFCGRVFAGFSLRGSLGLERLGQAFR
jgi:hypothetical protein